MTTNCDEGLTSAATALTGAPAAATMLARLQDQLSGKVPPPPIATLIGFKLAAVAPGAATVTLEAGPQHANPMGTLHGGVLCDIADAAMGIAYAANLAEAESFTTLELKISFLKPVWTATLTAEAKVLKQGRTTGLVECRITDEKGSLAAHATCMCMTLRGASAQGR
ncbi:MAG: PaaI family thioesterase [Terriglobales bacterium]